MNSPAPEDWLLLIASLPTPSATARMRIWRAVKALGCAAVRDGVYLLPFGPGRAEALSALAEETVQEGGQAWVMQPVPRTTEQAAAFVALFDRSQEHRAFFEALGVARAALSDQGTAEIQRTLRKLRKEYEALMETDFFPSDASVRSQSAWADFQEVAQAALSPGEPQAQDGPIAHQDANQYQGRTWATRRKLWADRVACAWLIRRFIDPQARFVWLDQPKDCPSDAVGFDFDGAAFTHVGHKVSFEVLMASFGLEADQGLQGLAALVHALDVGGPLVPEARGFEAILKGASHRLQDDDALLAEISLTLDSLHMHFQQGL